MNKINKLLLISVMFFCSNVFASSQVVSFQNFLKFTKSLKYDLETTDCTYRIEQSPLDVSIRINKNEEIVEFSWNDKSNIIVDINGSDNDGSFSKTYKIDDVGTITHVHADDAYDSLTFSNFKNSINCLIEY